MKKFIFLTLGIFIVFLSIFGIYLYSFSKPTSNTENINLSQKQKILDNSSWIYLNEEDFFGYLNGTYTEPVQKIITSLEDAIPVIFKTSNDKFGNFENSTFIVASAFDISNKVYVYYYDTESNSYIKNLTSFESLLNHSLAAFIYSKTEE